MNFLYSSRTFVLELFKNILEQNGSNLFDTLIVFLKEFFEKVNFEKNEQTTTKA